MRSATRIIGCLYLVESERGTELWFFVEPKPRSKGVNSYQRVRVCSFPEARK